MLLERAPSEPQIWFLNGRLLYQQGNVRSAVLATTSTTHSSPQNKEALVNYTRALDISQRDQSFMKSVLTEVEQLMEEEDAE